MTTKVAKLNHALDLAASRLIMPEIPEVKKPYQEKR